MLTFIDFLQDNTAYISSSKLKGVMTYPGELKMVINRPDDELNILGGGKTKGYSIVPVSNYTKSRLAYFGAKSKKRSSRPKQTTNIHRIWNPQEQVSYFMPQDKYDEHFGSSSDGVIVMSFDIEVATIQGRAPDKDNDRIIMIGYEIFNTNGTAITEKVIIDEPHEEETILEFLRAIYKYDPELSV